MSWIFLAAILVIAGIISFLYPFKDRFVGKAAAAVLFLAAFLSICATSFVTIASDRVGHLKRIYGESMPPGAIIALEGEQGPQAEILPPGFHFSLFLNIFYTVEELEQVDVPAEHYGMIFAKDGAPLPENQNYAAKWPDTEFSQMLDANYF